MRRLLTPTPDSTESVSNCYKRLIDQLDSSEELWGSMIPRKVKGQATTAQETEKNKYLACAFLAGADRGRFKELIDSLYNDCVAGSNNFPKSKSDVVTMLTNYRGGSERHKHVDDLHDGTTTSFGQNTTAATRTCWKCGDTGHIKNNCPLRKNKTGDDKEKSNIDLMISPMTKLTGWDE